MLFKYFETYECLELRSYKRIAIVMIAGGNPLPR